MGRKKKKLPKLTSQPQKYFDEKKVNEFLKSYTILLPFIIVNNKFNSLLKNLLATEINGEKIIDIQNKPELLRYAAYFKAHENFKTLVGHGKANINTPDSKGRSIIDYALIDPKIWQGGAYNFIFDVKMNKNSNSLVRFIHKENKKLYRKLKSPQDQQYYLILVKPHSSRNKNIHTGKISEYNKTKFSSELHNEISNFFKILHRNITQFFTSDLSHIEKIKRIRSATGKVNHNEISHKEFRDAELKVLQEDNLFAFIKDDLGHYYPDFENGKKVDFHSILNIYEKIIIGKIDFLQMHSKKIIDIINYAKAQYEAFDNSSQELWDKAIENLIEALNNKRLNDELLKLLKYIFNELKFYISTDKLSVSVTLPELLEIKRKYYKNEKAEEIRNNGTKEHIYSNIFLLNYPNLFEDVKNKKPLNETIENIKSTIENDLNSASSNNYMNSIQSMCILNIINDLYLDINENLEKFIIEKSRILLRLPEGPKDNCISLVYYPIYLSALIKRIAFLDQKPELRDKYLKFCKECLEVLPPYIKYNDNITIAVTKKIEKIYNAKLKDNIIINLKDLYNVYKEIPQAAVVIKYYMIIETLNSKNYTELNNHISDVNAVFRANEGIVNVLTNHRIKKQILNIQDIIKVEEKIETENNGYKKIKETYNKNEKRTEISEKRELEIGLNLKFNKLEVKKTDPNYISPQELHDFIGQYKANYLKTKLTDLLNTVCWSYKGKNYCTSDENIYQISSKIYLYLNEEELKDKYKNIEHLLKSANNALLHGFVNSAEGACGVKFLKNKGLITIKVPSKDDRICARKILENSEGIKLILFDEILIHKEIDKLPLLRANKNWLEAITVIGDNYRVDLEPNPLGSTMPTSTAEWEELCGKFCEKSQVQTDNPEEYALAVAGASCKI